MNYKHTIHSTTPAKYDHIVSFAGWTHLCRFYNGARPMMCEMHLNQNDWLLCKIDEHIAQSEKLSEMLALLCSLTALRLHFISVFLWHLASMCHFYLELFLWLDCISVKCIDSFEILGKYFDQEKQRVQSVFVWDDAIVWNMLNWKKTKRQCSLSFIRTKHN